MKRIIIGSLILLLITCLMLSYTVPTFATSIQEEENKKEELEGDLEDAQQTLQELKNLKSNTAAYVKELDNKLSKLDDYINDLEQQYKAKQQEIDQANQSIAQKEAEIQVQYEAMKKRIQFLYENGETGYIDMILGSQNLSELLNKAEYLSSITEYDRSMLEEIKQAKAQIEQTKAQLVNDQAELETLKQTQEAKQEDIEVLVSEKNQQISTYNSQISEAQQLANELKEAIAEKADVIEALKKSVDDSSNAYTGGSGMFAWPLSGYTTLSDDYGWRTLNGESQFHNGIDIPAPAGTPVKSVYSGRVFISRYSESAGNWVVIYHGNNIYSEYMHLTTRSVSEGDTITQGQVIGTVGNTGYSQGNHLHFGVILQSGSAFSTSGRVNPHPYLGR